MHTVTMLWSGVAGMALTLAAVLALLWLLDRRGVANLALSVAAVGVAGLSIAELGMMHSASPAEYGDWVWWFHLPNYLATVGLVAFVHLQFGTGRPWLAVLVVGLRTVVVLVNFAVRPNVNWSEISALRTIPFLGEQVSVIASAVVRKPVQWLATLAALLFVAYVADALTGAWRLGDREMRRKALVICGGILSFIVLAILESQLVVWGVARIPVVVAPPFLILMAAITYELSQSFVASSRMEREALRLREELAHVARVSTVSQLSGSLAHELKQPLTSILANAQAAQLMLEGGSPDRAELRAILEDIRADDLRADAIIERARALMKRGAIDLQELSVGAVVRDVFALVRTDAIKRGVALESSVPDALPKVRADRVQLSQVLLNLVVNAMDAVSGQAAQERRVTIEAKHAPDAVELAVVDSGPGIPAELLPRLFQPFVTTKRAGMGIGLAVSRAIVQAHGGELRAHNNAGSGATFSFTLNASHRAP